MLRKDDKADDVCTLSDIQVTPLGELSVVEGSRILTFDRVHYSSGPLASFASREGIIGWNDAFSDLFDLVKSQIYTRTVTCGELVKSHAGGEETLNLIRAAMRVVDGGDAACFSARNETRDRNLLSISVAVLPISFEFMDAECTLLVGFQSVSSDLQGHFDTIKRLFYNKQSAAFDMLEKWAKVELMEFLRRHPVAAQIYRLMSLTLPSQNNHVAGGSAHTRSPSRSSKSKSGSNNSSSQIGSEDLKAYTDSSSQAVAAVSERGQIVGANVAFRKALGYAKHELKRRAISSIIDIWSEVAPEHCHGIALRFMNLSCKDGTQKLVRGLICEASGRASGSRKFQKMTIVKLHDESSRSATTDFSTSRSSRQLSTQLHDLQHHQGAAAVLELPGHVENSCEEDEDSARGITAQGDVDNRSVPEATSRDSLDSFLERGSLVAGVNGEIDPEAYRLAKWWNKEGADAFVKDQPYHLRQRAKAFWLDRYTSEQTNIRVELARHCLSTLYVRQQLKEEIFGVYFLCRCGVRLAEDVTIYPPYAAATAILKFLEEATCQEMRWPGARPAHYRALGWTLHNSSETLHPSLHVRIGVGALRNDILAAWELDDSYSRSSEGEQLDGQDGSSSNNTPSDSVERQHSGRGGSTPSDSLELVREQGRRSIEKLLRGRKGGSPSSSGAFI